MNELTQRNNLNEIKRDKWEETFMKSMQKQALSLSNAHLGKLFKMGFWAFYISFISNTWTRPTLQPMNKDLLQVLVVLGTTLVIISLRLKRKKARDSQALLEKDLKKENSQIKSTPFICSQKKFPS